MRGLVVVALVACNSASEPLHAPARKLRPAHPESPRPDAQHPAREVTRGAPTHDLVETGGPRVVAPDGPFAIAFADIAADGSRYAVIERARDACKVRVHASANRAVIYAGDHGCPAALALSPDAKQLAIIGGRIDIVDLATGKQTQTHAIDAVDARWLRAGIVAKLANRDVAVLDPASGRTRTLGQTTTLAASGDHVVTETVVEQNAVAPCPPADCFPAPRLAYHRHDLRTGATNDLMPFPELYGTVAVAENGSVAIKTLYVLYTWGPDGNAQEPIHVGFANGGSPPALSADGRWYAIADGDYRLRVYDLGASAEIADFSVRGALSTLQFDRGGRLHGWLHAPITWELVPRTR